MKSSKRFARTFKYQRCIYQNRTPISESTFGIYSVYFLQILQVRFFNNHQKKKIFTLLSYGFEEGHKNVGQEIFAEDVRRRNNIHLFDEFFTHLKRRKLVSYT